MSASGTRNYNDTVMLSDYLSDLSGLCQLHTDRHEAGHDRKERMREFCVLGRFYLDSCGNFGLLEKAPADLYRLSFDPEHPKKCPPVMTLGELELFMRGDYISWSGYRLPAPDDECPVCQRGWTIEDCHTVEWTQAHHHASCPVAFHPKCLAAKRAREQRDEFLDMFAKAGFSAANVNLITIPNDYWRNEPYAAPWYLAQVRECAPFKIGWRKRVISIDWSSTNISLPDLFEGEDVTREPMLIHAWGYEKGAAYLKKLVPELEKSR